MMSDIKSYISLLSEGEYIPAKPRTVKLEIDHWDEFPRLMIRWHDPYYKYDTYDKGTMVFYDDISFQDAMKKFKKLGIPYTIVDDEASTNRDNELKSEPSLSPYPSNTNIFKHEF